VQDPKNVSQSVTWKKSETGDLAETVRRKLTPRIVNGAGLLKVRDSRPLHNNSGKQFKARPKRLTIR
jgi:hypothetical protein